MLGPIVKPLLFYLGFNAMEYPYNLAIDCQRANALSDYKIQLPKGHDAARIPHCKKQKFKPIGLIQRFLVLHRKDGINKIVNTTRI